jgi:putative autotransporter adhesin-like protein
LTKKWNRIKWNGKDHLLSLYITAKDLDRINLSGACDLYMETPFETNDLKITASGASDLDLMKIEGNNIKIITSGASDIDNGDLVATKVYINASGASDGDLNIVAKVLDMIASGASDFDIDVDVDDIIVSAHGSSDFRAKGKSKTFKIDVSGSSEMKAYDLISDTVIVEASGSSNCRVHAIKLIDASSSGTSTIYFSGKPDVSKVNVSGVATIKSK